jgi:type IX secretion system PorP/SprF family membrane protein
MKFLPTCLIVIVLMLPCIKTQAQADISMATHWYNRANYNPASIARTDYLYLFSNYRQQWEGVNGAPRVFNVQASQYFHKLRSAFGLSVVSDKIGATQALNPMFTYAYRLSDKDWALSFGLAAGAFSRRVDGSLFEAENPTDPSIYNSMEKSVKPDFNFGCEFQNTNFIFGFSSTHLLSIFDTENLYLNTNHRYVYAIYKNDKSKFYNYNIGLQLVNHFNLTILEINSIFRVKQLTGLQDGTLEIFDVGLTYRTTRQITALFGLNISSNTRLGYAYDHSFISGYNRNGTHEIILEWRIPCKVASTSVKCGNHWYY